MVALYRLVPTNKERQNDSLQANGKSSLRKRGFGEHVCSGLHCRGCTPRDFTSYRKLGVSVHMSLDERSAFAALVDNFSIL